MNMMNGSNVTSDSDSLNAEAGPGKFSIPNLISIFRLVIVPVLLYAAWTHKANLFLVLFCILLLMSFADGYLADKLGYAFQK